MFHSGQRDQLEELKSRQAPFLNLFVNFPFGNHAMLPPEAYPDVSGQERSYREPRISSFASSGTPSKSRSRGVELIEDPADGSSCERKVVGKSSKPVVDVSWSVSSKPPQERVTVYGEDEIPKATRKVRPASQGSELQVSVRNDTASRERKSVFRRLTRPVSVFERLSSSPSGDDNRPFGDFDPPLPGMIVGCTRNSVRKFMDLKIFGQPVARQSLVLRVVPGTKLFLFNYHTKELYGVYEATSRGKLRPHTLVVDSKDLLAQVSWKMWEKCPNLHISVFRRAIEENFVNNKFKFDLNQAQVDSLVDLFMASTAPPIKSARRKVECVPLVLDRAAKRPRRFKDSEGGGLGGPKEGMDNKVSLECYTRHGVPVGVKRPVLDRSLPTISKNYTGTRKNQSSWSPGGFPMPTSASPALTVGCVSAQKETTRKSVTSFGAPSTSTCHVLGTPDRNDSADAGKHHWKTVTCSKRAGRGVRDEDETILTCAEAVSGRENIESRSKLPRSSLAKYVNPVEACWRPNCTDALLSESVNATGGVSLRQKDKVLDIYVESSIEDFASMKSAASKVGASPALSSSTKDAGAVVFETCGAGYGVEAKAPVQENLEGATESTFEALQVCPTKNTPEQLGAFLRVNYLSAQSPMPETACQHSGRLQKVSGNLFLPELRGAADANLDETTKAESVKGRCNRGGLFELNFTQPVSGPDFQGDSLTRLPTLTLPKVQVFEDWESSAAKQLPFFQQEISEGEPAGISDHILSPAVPKTGCRLSAEEHKFLCVEMPQVDQPRSILDEQHDRGGELSGDSEGANSDNLKLKQGFNIASIVAHFGNCTGIICGENNYNLKIEKEGPSMKVEYARKCPTNDVAAVDTSIGHPGPFEGLDLNRPAFEDDDEFLEVEKDGLESDSGDGEEYMEEQPIQSKLPMRTLEDLKPMKLLSNFRAT